MKFRGLLILVVLVTLFTEEICAGRFSSSRSSSRSSSGGSRSSWGGRSGSSHTSRGSTSHNSGSSSSTHYSSSHGQSHNTHPAGQTTHQTNKDITSSFLHGEGGGATRPAQTKPPASMGTNYSPSAPHSSYGTSQSGKPMIEKDPRQMSHAPSAPPSETVSKATLTTSNNLASNNHFGQPSGPYNPNQPISGVPAWGNPHLGPNHPSAPNSQPPHVGFKEHLYTPSTGTGSNLHYPSPHAPNTPYPVHGSNPPYPVHPSNPPYPVHGSNPPYPVHGSNPPHPTYGSNPSYPIQHGTNMPHPMGTQSFGHPSYPAGAPTIPGQHPHFNSFGSPPNQPPLGNPYSTGMHYTGSAFHTPSQAQYAPQVLSQPAGQPFVPGQTVIMMPGQQDSGRGLGQIFKEALVFSTVNAAVNRVINPHHHYVTESRIDSSSSGVPTTHITYNNQYFNTYPGANGTVEGNGSSPPGAPAFTPGNVGTTSVAGVPNISGTVNINVPTGSPHNAGPSGISGGTSQAVVASGSGATVGTNNNNQGSASIQGAPGNQNQTLVNVPQYRVSDDDLLKISEELFAKQAFNLSKYIQVNLQNRSKYEAENITDDAKEPLFFIQPELLDYPTVHVTRSLYDNYEFNSSKKEERTLEERKEEKLLIDTFLETTVMSRAMQWLSDYGFIDPDDFERKDTLRHIWFNHFDGTTSGFERIFAAENYGNMSILGVQDWLYFQHEETNKRINYMGYVDQLKLGDSASLLKLNFQMDGITRPNATIFVGTLPELEMSLYTICFYARLNNLCPVSLGGTRFNIFTHSFRYFGNDLIDLGLPIF